MMKYMVGNTIKIKRIYMYQQNEMNTVHKDYRNPVLVSAY